MIKIKKFCKTAILSGLVLLFSCSQDPIFFTISTEPAPIPPRIPGSPTNIAVFERNGVPIMYVASGSLHWYAKSEWDSPEYDIPQPDGKIIGIAAAKDYLYALSISSSEVTTTLRRIGRAENEWNDIPITGESKYTLIQTIYADPDTGRLFAGAMNNNDIYFGILYLDDSAAPVLRLIGGDTEMLSGAASRDGIHYLSTRGDNSSSRHKGGLFKIAETDLAAGAGSADVTQLFDLAPENEANNNRLFMGMIKLEDGTIIAVERNGGIFFEVLAEGFRQIKYSNGEAAATGRYATGALALWREVIFNDNGSPPSPGERKMLVAGIQGGLYSSSSTTTTSYTHGYVEFYLTSDGKLDLANSRNDPPNITVDSTDRYTATIGKHPINYFYQASSVIDDNMTFFASTQTAGLWSYRKIDDMWQWNAEK